MQVIGASEYQQPMRCRLALDGGVLRRPRLGVGEDRAGAMLRHWRCRKHCWPLATTKAVSVPLGRLAARPEPPCWCSLRLPWSALPLRLGAHHGNQPALNVGLFGRLYDLRSIYRRLLDVASFTLSH